MNRRQLLVSSGAFAATFAIGRHIARAATNPFTLGVASGEPSADGFVLWTRLASNPLAPDGFGGISGTVTVLWEELYLHQQGLDTSTPSGPALFQMLGVFCEFEREMIRERVRAGLARAKHDGVPLGRPKLEDADPERAAQVKAMRAGGEGVRKIARELGVGVGTVLRLSA